ncbi:MAG: class I SAM-dependent DNA methyltransferase [Myxococcota bacterium]|jgi:type I restriction enzyme M protein|nr:class I SAM-dependent DNA methyltransferase [Myxococcota bacterium]
MKEEAERPIDKKPGEQDKRPIDKNPGEQDKRPIDQKPGEQAERPINKNLGEQAKRPINKNFGEKVSFIWSVADLLRGDYKQSEYGRVILPLLVLRRLDQVLARTRQAVLDADAKYPADTTPEALRERLLLKASGESFYNTSRLSFDALIDDANNAAANLVGYVHGFSRNVRDIMEKFRFEEQVARLDASNLLFLVLRKFVAVDLDPYLRAPDGSPLLGDDGKPRPNVSNLEMGTIFEELIRKFSEQSNETAGEHFTPREVIKFMVTLLFAEDDALLRTPGIVRTIFDPACGTGGMLSVAEEQLSKLNPQARLQVYGQELNGESYAICKADMLIKGQQADNIKFGNSFNEDGLPELQADYLISNPPFGVDWSKAEAAVKAEHEQRGFAGRFGPGLPRKNDGSLLFLLHMLSKKKPTNQGGSRLAIVFNGSPLFTGAAGSGESEIRRWILENDWLEAIVALPDQMFYNTGISTYIWLLSNRKAKRRKGKVQLINGVSYFQKMRKSLGDKRKELGEEHIDALTRLYADFQEGPDVKIFDNADFGFHRITVERPLQLNFQASAERLARLEEQSAWQALLKTKKKGAAAQAELADGQALQAAVLSVLQAMDANKRYQARPDFEKALKSAAKAKGVSLPAPLHKAIIAALSERDERAAVCMLKGKPEPDPELRDYENVPLREDIDAYMKREVLPHVPDAWVDHDKTKVGYEIPFTRHFYVYEPPRPLAVIEQEIRDLEREIQGMLAEVLG